MTNPITPVLKYKAAKLSFKKGLISMLKPTDYFQIETPDGTFQMSKAQFDDVFFNVVLSTSYDAGVYHYARFPIKSLQFILKAAVVPKEN